MSESLSCSQEKGEVVCEKPLISSELLGENESTSLAAKEKGEDVRERIVSHDEILMQKLREKQVHKTSFSNFLGSSLRS